MKTLNHKVCCSDCGKEALIEIQPNRKNKEGWIYWGKMNINTCKTDKYFYKIPEGEKGFENWVKVENPHYDPEAKRKIVEMWSCPGCVRKLKSLKVI